MDSWMIAFFVIIVLFVSFVIIFLWKFKGKNVIKQGIVYMQQMGDETSINSFPRDITRTNYLKWIQNALFNTEKVQNLIKSS
jgi:hypothetical protein